MTDQPPRRKSSMPVRVFTLAEAIDSDATEVTVNESTKGMNTVTGFFEHNSVLLHIGDELMTFGAVR